MKYKIQRNFIFTVCEIISLLILFLNESFIKDFNYIIYTLFLTLGITIFTNSLSAFISDKFKSNELNEIASYNFSVLKDCQEYGLIGIYKEIPFENDIIKNEIINSKELHIVMNDGKRFICDNIQLLEERIRIKNHTTTFIIENFKQEDIMDALTRKNGHSEDPDYYKKKIESVIKYHIKSLKSKCNNEHSFHLYLNPNYNTLSIILTDNYAIFSIYRVAPGKTKIPHFIFKRGGNEYEYIKNDVESIKNKSSCYKL